MYYRKNVKDLLPAEKTAYVEGVMLLKNNTPSQFTNTQYNQLHDMLSSTEQGWLVQPTNRYDDYVLIHHVVRGGAHQGPAFGSWHRRYLQYFEYDMQQALNDDSFRIPYWDWSDPASYPFTADFLGGDGDATDNDHVKSAPFGTYTDSDGDEVNNWPLNIIGGYPPPDVGIDDQWNYLRRNLGSDPTLQPAAYHRHMLEEPTYDASPWDTNADSFRNYLEGWENRPNYTGGGTLPSNVNMHNLGHVHTGGTMLPPTSPNDPVFWLNHSMVDMLWAVWQQKHPTSPYVPNNTAGTNLAGHRIGDLMALFSNFFGHDATNGSTTNYHGATIPGTSYSGHWYQTDLPDITNETGGSLNFGDVPDGLTTYKAVRLRTTSCSNVTFRITGAPGGNFDVTPMGFDFPHAPDADEPFEDVLVWFQFQSSGGSGVEESSAVEIRAYIDDTENYYRAAGETEYEVGMWTVSLAATPEARDTTAVSLVLDYSGSMNNLSGSTLTRKNLMSNAAGVFAGLLNSNDGLGLVKFNHLSGNPDAEELEPVTLGGLGTPTQVRNSLNAITADGRTPIGAGILQGIDSINDAQASAATPYDNTAIVVLSDGRENEDPRVSDISGSINSTTYAVGMGEPSALSTATLGLVTNNTGGEQYITGDLTSDEQQFLVTKYFVQIMAGINSEDTVLDPQGVLHAGAEHRIPFNLTGADVSADVIVLTPFPQIVDVFLETPTGKVIDTGIAASEPNIVYKADNGLALYRFRLPAIASLPGDSHNGTWHVVLRLTSKMVKELLKTEEFQQFWINEKNRSVPYSLIVNTFSNVKMNAQIVQSSYEPGAELVLHTQLTEYTVPLTQHANVWAEVTLPNGTQKQVTLTEGDPGNFQASLVTSIPGLYRVRMRATGTTIHGGDTFTRDKELTAGVWRGGDQPEGNNGRDVIDWLDQRDEDFCELVSCLLSSKTVNDDFVSRLKKLGINFKGLRDCFKRYCKEQHRPERKPPKSERPKAADKGQLGKLASIPQFNALIGLLSKNADDKGDDGVMLGVDTAAKPTAVKREVSTLDSLRNRDLIMGFGVTPPRRSKTKKKATRRRGKS